MKKSKQNRNQKTHTADSRQPKEKPNTFDKKSQSKQTATEAEELKRVILKTKLDQGKEPRRS